MIRARTKPRRGQPSKAQKKVLRDDAYERSGGRCELRKSKDCNRNVMPSEGSIYERAHLVHLQAKRVHGWAPENLALGCYACHIIFMHQNGGCDKIVPKKERAS